MKTTALSAAAAATGFSLILILAGETAAGLGTSGFSAPGYRATRYGTAPGDSCEFVKRLQDPFERQLYLETIENDSMAQEGEIDPISRDCMGCHDNVAAVAADTWVANGSGSHGTNHPIGMRYDEAATRRGGLNPAPFLPQTVVLLGGRVACISCHDMTNAEGYHLAVTDRESRLCLTCHNK